MYSILQSVQSDLAAFGRWCFLAGVFLMVSGDGLTTFREPIPAEAWPWLYLVPLAVSFVLMVLAGRIDPRRPARAAIVSGPLAVLLAAFALSTVFSQDRSLSGFALVSVIGIAIFWWCTAQVLEDRRLVDATWIVAALAILVLAVHVINWRLDEGLDQITLHVKTVAWLGKLQIAWVFNLFAPILLARCISERRMLVSLVNGTAWAAAGVANYLLFARMGLLIFVVSALLIFAVNTASRRRRLALAGVVAVAGTVLVVATMGSSTYLAATFDPARNPGIRMRLDVYEEAWRLFRAHPVVGIGIGTFDKVAYETPGSSANLDFREKGWHAHNVPLHVLTEAGILGFAAWLFLWYTILKALVVAWRTGDHAQRLFSSATLVSAFALHALSMTEALIAARAIGSLRMHLTIALIVAAGLRLSLPAVPERAAASGRAAAAARD